jgi:hypothetical protein
MMQNENLFSNIADYLSNAIDRESDHEMIQTLCQTFDLPKPVAEQLVVAFIQEFSNHPIIIETHAVSLIKEIHSI